MAVDLDQMFEALSRQPRRELLILLHQHDTMSFQKLAAHIDGDKQDNKLTLRHSHLPKLADIGYISWNWETRTISKGPHFESIEPILDYIIDSYTQPEIK